MKNIALLVSRIIVLILIAGLVSSAIGFILLFIFGNLGLISKAAGAINTSMNILFALLIGYKLNDLVRDYRQQ